MPRRLAVACVVAALSAAWALAAVMVAVADAPWLRSSGYGHSNSCLHRLHHSSVEREVVIIGSSRIAEALDPSAMARHRGLDEDSVVNLGRPFRDPGADADNLDFASDGRRLKLAIVELHVGSREVTRIEVELDPGSEGAPRRFGAFDYSHSALLLRPLVSLFRDSADLSPLAHAHAVAGLIAWRLDETFRILMTGSWVDPSRPSDDTDPGRTNICAMSADLAATVGKPSPKSDAQAARFEAAFAGWDEDRPDYLLAPGRAPDRRAVGRMVEMARQRGFRLVFVYLPSRRTPLPGPEFAEQFLESTGAEIVIPTRALVDDLDRRGLYYDNAHLTRAGSEEFTAWFDERLGRSSP